MVMKALIAAAAISLAYGASAQAQESAGSKKLVVYFSKTNNTRTVAEQVQAQVGGDTFRVERKAPYPDDYRELTRVARAEQDSNARPELAQTLSPEEMRQYDVVFVGYPNWWGTIPMPIVAFLEQFDFAGKTVIPFCTHEGSGLGRGPGDIERLCPGATMRQGLAIRGGSVSGAQNEVADWLRGLGYVQ